MNRGLITLLLALAVYACSHTPPAPAPPSPPSLDSIALGMADSAMRSMSVEEMIGQLFMPAVYTRADAATERILREYVADCKVGGIVFLQGDTASLATLTSLIDSISPTPALLAIDAEWGLGMRLSDAPSYPHNSALHNASEQSMYDYGSEVGTMASHLGLNMVLGPVLDVASVSGSVMADRSYGADAARVADLGCAYSRGLLDAGVMPVAKHFPGHGATAVDSHRHLPVISDSRATLLSRDLLPFRQYASLEFPAIMVGHVAMPSLTNDSLPASISHKLLTDLLRTEIKYRGLIITDAMNMQALDRQHSACNASILAGADIILVPQDTRRAEEEILASVQSGEIPYYILADRCRRILYYKYLQRVLFSS